MDKVYFEKNVYGVINGKFIKGWRDIDVLLNDPLANKIKNDTKLKKEVKKLSRPYFETEVVKVKRNYRKECVGEICIRGERIPIYIENDRIFFYGEKEKPKPKGNWLNGENLDEIKFPCFCSFKAAKYNYRSFGELDLIVCRDFEFYRLRELKQVDKKMVYGHQFIKTYLKELIEWFEVKILKGKVIIFEEESDGKK